tara:strand:+ start:3535 stop:5268 length:1734 start_codon:yes stop_codon:yes gene_type:complete
MAYELPAQGITGIQKVADHLADFGRFGDGHLVHASEGEAVVPSAVLDENPRLKTALFTQMRERGLDPNRYIVGDKLNSINPVTGQPEFGVFGDIWGGIKNVVKAIAPVVLPVALSMTRLGPIWGAAAGTGIASLIGGASFGRSLKNSVIAGGIGGLYAGLTGAQGAQPGKGWEGFKTGVSDAFKQPFMPRAPRIGAPIKERTLDDAIPGPAATSPVAAASEIRPITAAEASLPLGQLQPLGAYKPGNLQEYQEYIGQPFQRAGVDRSLFPLGLQPTPYEAQIGQFGALRPMSQPGVSAAQSLRTTNAGGLPGGVSRPIPFEPRVPIASQAELFQTVDPTNNIFRGTQLKPPSFQSQAAPTVGFTDVRAPVPPVGTVGGRGRFAKARDLMVRSGLDPDQVEEIKQAAYDKAFARTRDVKIADLAYNKAGPGMWAKYGPSTALGLGAAGLFGAFKPGDEPEPVDFYTQMYGKEGSALERLRNNPGMYSVGVPRRAYTPATLEDIRYNAVGGPINQDNFPPRIGPIYGSGTGTSDDVPAMLSDGEYVMTAKAVRGAGNGNRKQGMHNMYNMMRQFEGQAV